MSMVEWKKLGDIVKRNKGIPITAGQMSELNTPNGTIRVFAAGQTIADIDEEELPENNIHRLPSIIVKSRGYIDFEFYELPFTHKNELWSYSFKNKKLGKYIYYYLTNKTDSFRAKAKANSVKLPQLCVSDTDDYYVPIPSEAEQSRIVGILDTFTASIANLKEQIGERRKQYEHYRDQLLDLEGKEGVEMKTLGEVMQIVRGASPRPIKNFITTDVDGVNWIKIGDVVPNAKYITKTQEKITKEGSLRSRYLKAGDFILSNSMSFGRPYILKIDGCIHDGWIAMSGFDLHLLPDYLYEILNSNSVQRYWQAKANNGGAMTNLNSDIVRSTIIPLPSLPEQSRIVSILDQFEASIANLEAQLQEREKQYEHYRNQLLTFE